MAYITGEAVTQGSLFPVSLDELISTDHPGCVIAADGAVGDFVWCVPRTADFCGDEFAGGLSRHNTGRLL